jgi:pimeloyl-ACP methyl ester carboxylesterase
VNLRLTKRGAGIVGAVLGITAAGVAAGVAAERYLVRRSRAGDDPYADEPFGGLPATTTGTMTTEEGIDLYVETVDPEGSDAAPGAGGAAGAGDDQPTLVFVHGFCLDMGTFHFQRTAFAKRYRLVFYDQPGHGRSGRITTGEYALEGLGASLRAVIDRYAPDGRVVLVGHSMGGMAIMALAERYPEMIGERVAGVAFISSSAGDLDEVRLGMPQVLARFRRPLLPVVRMAGPVSAAVIDRVRHASTDLAWLLTRRYGFGTQRPSPALVSYVERMNSTTSLDVIARYLQTIYGHDRLLALGPLQTVPVLVICGDHDQVTPLEHSREIAEALPNARFQVIADGGHVALLEHSDEVNDLLDGFIREIAG